MKNPPAYTVPPPLLKTNRPGSYGITICNNGLDNASLKMTKQAKFILTNDNTQILKERCSEIVNDKGQHLNSQLSVLTSLDLLATG